VFDCFSCFSYEFTDGVDICLLFWQNFHQTNAAAAAAPILQVEGKSVVPCIRHETPGGVLPLLSNSLQAALQKPSRCGLAMWSE
jgi:hypothetical protein